MDTASGIYYGTLAAVWVLTLWEIFLFFRQTLLNKWYSGVPLIVDAYNKISHETIRFSLFHFLLNELRLVKQNPEMPRIFRGIESNDRYQKTRSTTSQMVTVIILSLFAFCIIKTVKILLYTLSFFWMCSTSILDLFGVKSEYVIGLLFILIVEAFDVLLVVPWYAYYLFVYTNQSGSIEDTVILFIIQIIVMYIGEVLFMGLWWLNNLFVGLLGLEGLFAVIPYFITITVLMFLEFFFSTRGIREGDDYKPLEDGELKSMIEDLADKVNFPVSRIYIYRASRTTSSSNAFFAGFGDTKVIVLYDNILDIMTNKEIVAVLAHELGHWKKNHIWKMIIIEVVYVYLMCFLLIAIIQYNLLPIYEAFKFDDKKPLFVGLVILYNYVFIPFNYFCSFILISLVRHDEYEADSFAASLGYGKYLRSALIKLSAADYIFPIEDWLFSIFVQDHPSMMDRIKNLS